MDRHKSSTKTPFSTPATKRFCPSYFSTAEKSEISKPPSVERKLMAASLLGSFSVAPVIAAEFLADYRATHRYSDVGSCLSRR